jgi:hypothetical protein
MNKSWEKRAVFEDRHGARVEDHDPVKLSQVVP